MKQNKRPWDVALRFLSYRARSVQEVRQRLLKEFTETETDLTLDLLKSKNFLNDRTFAEYWIQRRETHRPRSKKVLEQELYNLGVERETFAPLLETLDDYKTALRSGGKIINRYNHMDEKDFMGKMFRYLQQHGFSYEISRNVSVQLWGQLTDPGDCQINGYPHYK